MGGVSQDRGRSSASGERWSRCGWRQTAYYSGDGIAPRDRAKDAAEVSRKRSRDPRFRAGETHHSLAHRKTSQMSRTAFAGPDRRTSWRELQRHVAVSVAAEVLKDSLCVTSDIR